ncbi:MAG: hypothetical protein ABSF95_19285 [Verrucomicrobiota bacterium]
MSSAGELRIAGMADLGGLGDNEGPPVFYRWTAANPLPVLLPWLGVLLLLLLKANRTAQAWWIWAPLCGVAGLSGIVPSALASWPSDELGIFQKLVVAIAFGLAVAWLVLNHIRRRGRFVTFLGFVLVLLGSSFSIMLISAPAFWPSRELGILQELVVAIAFGLAAAWLVSTYLGRRHRLVTFLGFVLVLLGSSSFIMLIGHLGNRDGLAWPAGEFAVATSLAIAAALTLVGLLCQRGYRPFVLCLWVLVLLLPVWLSIIMLWLMIDALRLGYAIDRHQIEVWCQDVGGLVRLSFAVVLPFLILSFANAFYRERLKGLLCLRPVAPPVPEERSGGVARG